MTSCTRSVHRGFWGFEKSQLVEFLPLKSDLSSCLGRRRLTFGAHRGLAAGATRGGGEDGKFFIERFLMSENL